MLKCENKYSKTKPQKERHPNSHGSQKVTNTTKYENQGGKVVLPIYNVGILKKRKKWHRVQIMVLLGRS